MSKFMQVISKLFDERCVDNYDKKCRAKKAISCKKAVECGDYKAAYESLLDLIDKNIRPTMLTSPSHNLTLKHNIPVECLKLQSSDEIFAVAAIINLYWMGFPHPCAHFDDWRARFGYNHTDKFYLRINGNKEHVGELRIITKDEYEDPLKHRPELRCDFRKPVMNSERYVRFYTNQLEDDAVVNYKILQREMRHNRIYLSCAGHYYEYSWQFCQG